MMRQKTPPATEATGELLKALQDLMYAVEVAEDNDWSESAKRLIAGAADRAAVVSLRVRGMPHRA